MADLSQVRRPNRIALLRKVQEQPMPPARIPLGPAKAAPTSPDPVPPASEPKAKAPDLQPQVTRTSGTRDPATTDGRRSEPTRDAKRSSAEGRNKTGSGSATATAVNDPPAVARSPTADAATSRYRFSLHFDDPALRQEAQQIAAQYGVPLAHIIRAVAADARVEADDFRDPAVAANLRPGGSVRVELTMDTELADAWFRKNDPLRVQAASIVLRPVAIAAFERAARQRLPELAKGK